MKHSARTLLASWLVPLLLGACQSGGSDTSGGERTPGFPAPDKDVIYDVSVRTLRDHGFTVDLDASSLRNGVATTRWRVNTAPFSEMGFRDKATVTIREVPNRPKYYVVETNVTRELNADQVQPGNPIAAEWKNAQRMPDLERVITMKIERFFLPSDASAEFHERYGTGAPPDVRLKDPAITPEEIKRQEKEARRRSGR
jgi:hypothetical protein